MTQKESIEFKSIPKICFLEVQEKVNLQHQNKPKTFRPSSNQFKAKHWKFEETLLAKSNDKMMHGRNIEEEMSRFEAEINAARAQAFIIAGGGAAAAYSGNPVISAPPSSSSAAVISAPPTKAKARDEEDVLATLEKYEQQVKEEAKHVKLTALAKDIASKKAKMMAESVKKSASTVTNNAAGGASSSGMKAPVAATISDETVKKAKMKKRVIRTGGGQMWEDDSLKDWDPNDFRIFCGDLGNDVTDEVLARTFGRYSSFQKAKVIRDKKTNKTRGYGFISFKDPGDFTRAMREMNGKYVGSRPIKMRKSNWKDRNIEVVKHKIKEKQKMGYKW